MNPSFDDTKRAVIGKWGGIFQRLGIAIGDGRHGPCPMCPGGKDRFIFDDKNGTGSWYCNQCDPHAGDGFALLMSVLGIDFKTACSEVNKIVGTIDTSIMAQETNITPETLRKIFKESSPAKKGDPVHRYLLSRGLHSMPAMLRCGKLWEAETKKECDTMLAVFSLPDGEAATMHRTFLGNAGKLDIEHPKRFLPTLKPLAGGSVRLYDAGPILGVAEGLETAIACHEQYSIPVWATIGTSMMATFEPPKEVEKLIVFSDNDENYAGQRAAYKLANRTVIDKKIPVSVEVPELPGEDFLDEIARAK